MVENGAVSLLLTIYPLMSFQALTDWFLPSLRLIPNLLKSSVLPELSASSPTVELTCHSLLSSPTSN